MQSFSFHLVSSQSCPDASCHTTMLVCLMTNSAKLEQTKGQIVAFTYAHSKFAVKQMGVK
jgi:hypothetical protein